MTTPYQLPPIEILTCNCGGVENLARKFLRPLVPNYMQIPLYQGQKARERAQQLDPDGALPQFLTKRGRYVVIVATDTKPPLWENIGSGDNTSKIRAEILVKKIVNPQ